MHDKVLTQYSDPNLRVYMVWVPKSRGLERDVPAATTQYPEPRALHFWDEPGVLLRGYRDRLNLSEDAWDMYLLYGPDATWADETPPAPLYWAHQLGSKEKPRLNGPWLDAGIFLEKLRQTETR
jgi:hypothetical protein